MTLLGTTDATVSRTAANAKAHRVAGSEIPGRVAEEDPEREHGQGDREGYHECTRRPVSAASLAKAASESFGSLRGFGSGFGFHPAR